MRINIQFKQHQKDMQSSFIKFPNATHHKRDQMRDQIRSKQIEEYKCKIRMHYHQYPQKGINYQIQPNKKDAFTKQHDSKSAYHSLSKYQIQNIQQSLTCLLSSNIHTQPVTRDFRLQFDVLINSLIIIEDQYSKFQLTNADRQRVLYILALASKFGNQGVQLWTIQQRCILSHYWHLLLKATLADTARFSDQANIDTGLKQINNALLYVSHFLTKGSQQNHIHNHNKCSVLDFTETEQQILQLTVSYFVQLLYTMSQSNNFAKNEIFGHENCNRDYKCLPHRCQQISNKLLYLYTLYIKQVMQQYEIQSIAVLEQNHNHIGIGNMRISVIKSIISIAIDGIVRLKQHYESNIGAARQIIADSINYICGLFNQFTQTLSLLPLGYFAQIERQSSKHSSDTFLGLLVSVCQLVLTVACQMEIHESEDSLSIGNNSSSFFHLIHNSDIIASFMDLLEDFKYYERETVAQLCSPNNSQLSTYILTCIFTEALDTESTAKQQKDTERQQNYQTFRQSQMKIRQKNTMELECLKIVSLFIKNFGINLDQEGNLGLRYLNRRADGLANQYYFSNLANTHLN